MALDSGYWETEAEWEDFVDNDEFWGGVEYARCSHCKTVEFYKSKFCPNCGKQMRNPFTSDTIAKVMEDI